MPELYGRKMTKQEYLRHVGDINQAFGLREFEYTSGKAAHIRCCEAENAGGLRFTVAENKGMDIIDFSYKGIRYGFVTKASVTSPYLADEQGMAYRGNLGAGFLYTAGLDNVGLGCEEDGFYHYAHGALKNTPARNFACKEEWSGDDCVLQISGDMRDAQFFGRNLCLHREIRTVLGESRLYINDTIENQGFSEEQYMLLYHMNLGWPILDAGTRLYAPILSDEPIGEHTKNNDADLSEMIAPIDNNPEYLHALRLAADCNGRTLAMAYNPNTNLGLYIRFNVDVLRYLIVWKCMCSGDYALGILPSSCKPMGRKTDRETGEAKYIRPFETLKNELEIGVVDGNAQKDALQTEIKALIRT